MKKNKNKNRLKYYTHYFITRAIRLLLVITIVVIIVYYHPRVLTRVFVMAHKRQQCRRIENINMIYYNRRVVVGPSPRDGYDLRADSVANNYRFMRHDIVITLRVIIIIIILHARA